MSKGTYLLFVISGILCAALGGLIFSQMPTLGILLILVGVVSSVSTVISSEAQRTRFQSLNEAQNHLLASQGIGNVYLELAHKEMSERGSWKHVESLLADALRVDPDNIDALAYLSTQRVLTLSFAAYLHRGNSAHFRAGLTEVKRMANRGLEISHSSHVFLDVLGIAADLEGNHKEAQRLFRESGRLRADPYWRVLLAVSLEYDNRLEEALEQLRMAQAEGAEDRTLDFQFGSLLQLLGDHDAALPFLKGAYGRGFRHPKLLKDLGENHFYRGDFGRVLRLEALNVLIYARYGALSWRVIGHMVSALRLYLIASLVDSGRLAKRLFRLASGSPMPSSQFRGSLNSLMFLGGLLLGRGLHKVAERNFRAVQAQRPNWAQAYNNLGICLGLQGRRHESLDALELALKLAPGNDIIRWNRDQCLSGHPPRLRDISEREASKALRDRYRRGASDDGPPGRVPHCPEGRSEEK